MRHIREYGSVILGALLMGVSLNSFLIPNKIAAGGISGIATILDYTLNIKPSIFILLANVPLFIIAFMQLGKRFVLNSVIGTVALSLAVEFAVFLGVPTKNLLLASIAGGVLMGAGIGILLSNNYTTGGTEIVAKLINKHLPHFSIGAFIFIVDGVIILASGFIFEDFDLSVYASLALFISTKVIDYIVEGVDFAKAALIISSKTDEIAEAVQSSLKRGVTGIKSLGMHSKQDRTMLMCIVQKNQFGKLKKIIYDIDYSAFVILTDVKEVYGEGFKKYS